MAAVADRSVAKEIVGHLRELRRRLSDEIRTNPTPIPRCDAQFNHLFEERERIAKQLDEMR